MHLSLLFRSAEMVLTFYFVERLVFFLFFLFGNQGWGTEISPGLEVHGYGHDGRLEFENTRYGICMHKISCPFKPPPKQIPLQTKRGQSTALKQGCSEPQADFRVGEFTTRLLS